MIFVICVCLVSCVGALLGLQLSHWIINGPYAAGRIRKAQEPRSADISAVSAGTACQRKASPGLR
jgi:hypothetical protein